MKRVWIALTIFILVLGTVFLIRNNGSSSSTPNIVQNNSGNIVNAASLATHNTLNDCWVSYNGKVYDVTTFLPNHPGSAQAILPYCGTADEFKNAFENQHGTRKVAMLMRVGTFIGDFDVMGAYKP